MKHAKNIKIEKNDKRKGTTLVLWILISVFIISYVFITIESATEGASLTKIIKEESRLRDENQVLSTRLIKESSLTTLEIKAIELGFIKPSDIIYILEPGSVAKVP